MSDTSGNYFSKLGEAIGQTWNRFWFTPADALPACVLRLLVGSIALVYVLTFSGDLVTWFGPHGLLPEQTVLSLNSPEGRATGESNVVTHYRLSYFYLAESATGLYLWHILGVVVAAAFTAGFYSRVTNVLTLVVVLSYVNRAPMIAGHMDPLLTATLFYLCFAPTGRYFAVDAWLRRRRAARQAHPAWERKTNGDSIGANIGIRMIQVHVCMFCLMMGLTKLAGQTWWMGEAMWVLIAQSDSRLIDLTFLRDNALVINAWTHAVVLFELVFPILIWKPLARPLLLVLGLVVWLPLMLVTGLIGFYVMLLIACLAFLPPEAMRRCLRMEPPAAAGSLAGAAPTSA